MEERRKFTENVLGASDEIYDYNCSPCEESGVYKEAHKYCNSCKLYYCKKCLGDHNKFPALRGHLIKEVTSQPKPAVQTGAPCVSVPAPPIEPCEKHPEEMIKMYCGEHDIVCCTVCIALDHRECKYVHYILNLTKDIRTSQEYIDYVEEVTQIKTMYEGTKQSIQDEIKTMNNVKTEIINEIKEYRRELVSRIEELESKSIETVNKRYKEITERMNDTGSHVDKLLNKVTQLVREIDNTSEAQLFVQMKKMRQMKNENDMIDKKLQTFEGLSFTLDDSIRNALDGVDGLAIANVPLKILSKKEYDIIFDDDKCVMHGVCDMCILDDDTLVLTCQRWRTNDVRHTVLKDV
ncbi:E3 ubiquitin-protein ligase TRIM33-like [Mercenaria mercenaria]|uniref:E3 ubiquitin-protein ligase TRIM33-like n=1 Tax=Mercenaria mercenaria TaxID=6596 RepID=UPI00234E39F0|nr:E3 ubiquitin-protein ligase TRIM33-like [Mercenaria mercenaria]